MYFRNMNINDESIKWIEEEQKRYHEFTIAANQIRNSRYKFKREYR